MINGIALLVSGLAAPVALALVALLGYLVGLKRRAPATPTARQTVLQEKMHRADDLLNQLESVSRRLRLHLASHHASMQHCRQRLVAVSQTHSASHQQAESEAIESFLEPADALSREIAQAYDQLRRDSRILAELRAW